MTMMMFGINITITVLSMRWESSLYLFHVMYSDCHLVRCIFFFFIEYYKAHNYAKSLKYIQNALQIYGEDEAALKYAAKVQKKYIAQKQQNAAQQ